MKIKKQVSGREKNISVLGDIECTDILRLKKEMEDLPSYSKVLVDLSGVTFANSSFVNFLSGWRARNPLSADKVKWINPSGAVQRILSASGLQGMVSEEPAVIQ
jgi:anti-anti-sigma regulatory factor